MIKPTNSMPIIRDFDVLIEGHQANKNESTVIGERSLIWYTDGSKMVEGIGTGIAGPKRRLSRTLGNTPTIFQAEIYAIDLCAYEYLNKGIRRAKVYIFSDSQAALKALRSYTFESKLPGNVNNLLSNWLKPTRSP